MVKISFIIPCFRVEKYLERCVYSILNQPTEDYEIVMIDDGSDDNTGVIADKIKSDNPSKNIVVVHQENQGLSGARNTGMSHASGKYIWFVDSDDFLTDNSLDKIVSKLEETDCSLMIMDYRFVNEKEEETRYIKNHPSDSFCERFEDRKDILVYSSVQACDKIYKRELLESNGFYFPKGRINEDLAVIPALYFKAESICYFPLASYNYRVRANSIMTSIKADKIYDGLKSMQDLIDSYKEAGQFDKYKDELEYLCVNHIYFACSKRTIDGDIKSPYLKKYRDFTYDNFPNFHSNKYLSKKMKIIVYMLDHKMYALLRVASIVINKSRY